MLGGRCACGATEYEVEDAFVYSMNCHCSKCRAATGSAYKPMGGIEREKLRVTREDVPLFVWGETDAGEGKWAHVTLGSLVDVPARLPDHHIFVGSKAPWEQIRDELPQHEDYARQRKWRGQRTRRRPLRSTHLSPVPPLRRPSVPGAPLGSP